jgi:hypothetical protein
MAERKAKGGMGRRAYTLVELEHRTDDRHFILVESVCADLLMQADERLEFCRRARASANLSLSLSLSVLPSLCPARHAATFSRACVSLCFPLLTSLAIGGAVIFSQAPVE